MDGGEAQREDTRKTRKNFGERRGIRASLLAELTLWRFSISGQVRDCVRRVAPLVCILWLGCERTNKFVRSQDTRSPKVTLLATFWLSCLSSPHAFTFDLKNHAPQVRSTSLVWFHPANRSPSRNRYFTKSGDRCVESALSPEDESWENDTLYIWPKDVPHLA